jgi:hypothetical protein
MEAKFSSETSVHFQQTTRRYIPENRALHNHRCENLWSYVNDVIFLLDYLKLGCESVMRTMPFRKTEFSQEVLNTLYVFVVCYRMLMMR